MTGAWTTAPSYCHDMKSKETCFKQLEYLLYYFPTSKVSAQTQLLMMNNDPSYNEENKVITKYTTLYP
jgi:transposase